MRVGFIGLGVMGRPMAANLLRGGHEVVVYSRSRPPVEALVASGATEAASPAAAAGDVEAVITMLPDTATVERVMRGPAGVLEGAGRGTLVIDMSTTSPRLARDVGALAAERGCDFLDAPVSGGERSAIAAELTIMVGGDAAAFGRALPLLRTLGQRVVHVGAIGAGQVTKACNQLVVLGTIELVAEALVLARAAGLDPARVREALLGGFARSRVLEEHGRRMLERDFAPGGRARLHAKDVEAVRELAHDRVPTPGFDAAVETLDRLIARGGGDLDHAALVTVIEDAADVRLTRTMEVERA
jgi:2-hydroxy-3-oxopropionate reductase